MVEIQQARIAPRNQRAQASLTLQQSKRTEVVAVERKEVERDEVWPLN
jgi:hypothetical protein